MRCKALDGGQLFKATLLIFIQLTPDGSKSIKTNTDTVEAASSGSHRCTRSSIGATMDKLFQASITEWSTPTRSKAFPLESNCDSAVYGVPPAMQDMYIACSSFLLIRTRKM